MLVILLNLRPAIEQYCANYKEKLEEDILNYPD
jgi:hypothetical protein